MQSLVINVPCSASYQYVYNVAPTADNGLRFETDEWPNRYKGNLPSTPAVGSWNAVFWRNLEYNFNLSTATNTNPELKGILDPFYCYPHPPDKHKLDYQHLCHG